MIGINDNKILSKGENFNLSMIYDEFFRNNLYSNYGEVATNLKTSVEKYSNSKKEMNIKNFDDM